MSKPALQQGVIAFLMAMKDCGYTMDDMREAFAPYAAHLLQPKALPSNRRRLHGCPARQGARPDGQDGISAVKDLSASASPATKEQQ